MTLVWTIEPSLCAVTTTPSMLPSASDETWPARAAGWLSARTTDGGTCAKISASAVVMPSIVMDFIIRSLGNSWPLIGVRPIAAILRLRQGVDKGRFCHARTAAGIHVLIRGAAQRGIEQDTGEQDQPGIAVGFEHFEAAVAIGGVEPNDLA